MPTRTRYFTDPAYRQSVIAAVGERHKQDAAASGNYRRLVALRKQRYGLRERIKHWQSRIGHAREKLTRLEYDIEKLELAWGRERAERKRMR